MKYINKKINDSPRSHSQSRNILTNRSFPLKSLVNKILRKPFRPVSDTKGSITIEAAVSLGFFLMMTAAFLNIFIVLNNQIKNEYTLNETLGKAAALGAIETYSNSGEKPSEGFDFNVFGNGITIENDEISVCNTYVYHTPFLPWYAGNLCISKRVCRRAWTGRTLSEEASDEDGEEIYVYVAHNGTVYHTHEDCTYLNLKISAISKDDIEEVRSLDGSKYYPCEACRGKGDTVYIANYGNRYHTKDCPDLNHNYDKVKLSEVTLPKCSKCSKKDD